MKTLWFCLAVIVGALLLAFILKSCAGCESQPLSGVVTAKQWVPAHDDVQMLLIADGNGGFTQIPQWNHYDDEWRIWVGNSYVRVTKEEFKRIEIQQYFEERR